MSTELAKGPFQIMPLMDENEFQILKEDIRQKGVIDPITFDEQGNIIDGYHRFRAFAELVQEGVDLPMFDRVVRKFDNEDDKIDYVISLNVKRRHLTPQQRADLVVTLRRRGYTMQKIADLIGVSKKTVSIDISLLPDDLRQELMTVERVSSDGRVFNAPQRVIQTGHQTLKGLQQQAANAIGTRLASNPPVTVQPPTEAPLYLKHLDATTDAEAQQRIIKAFSYYGGKFSHLDWLLPLLPPCKHFVDVFGGSGVVLLNRPASQIETYNDIDDYVVTFFRVLRDNYEELLRHIHLTPYSREERRITHRGRSTGETITDLEKARRFFVLACQSHRTMALATDRYLNSWKVSRGQLTRGQSYAIANWELSIDGLAYVAARLRTVQIENYPWEHVLANYDAPDTLFYLDPPYVADTREEASRDTYGDREMTDTDHMELAIAVHNLKGMVAISGYRGDLYDELYKDWHRFDMPVLTHTSEYAAERVESVWTNYRLER